MNPILTGWSHGWSSWDMSTTRFLQKCDLLRRGYGARRVSQALHHAGVDTGALDGVEPSEAEGRAAALAFARRRRLGPFGERSSDPKRREKQLAALVRAGHDFDTARALIDAANEQEAEEWASDAGY